MITANINYIDPAGFTYNQNEIEILGGFACLRDQFDVLGPDRVLGMRMNDVSTDSIAFSDSPASLTFNNGPVTEYTVSGVNLRDGVSNRRLEINGSGNLDQLGREGTVIFRFTPNYTGSPANDCPIFVASDASSYSPSTDNFLLLEHDTSGQITLRVRSNTGSNIINNVNIGFFSAIAGFQYVFQLNLDLATGNTELYINGVRLGSALTQTGNRDGANFHALGADLNGRPDCFIADFMGFNSVQPLFPNNYTVPIAPYVNTDPILALNAEFNADQLFAFTDSTLAEIPPNTDIRYALTVNSVPKYWDGAAWVNSDLTYAQTSDADVINANAAALDISTGVMLGLRMLLRSVDGLTTPCIDQTSITYNLSAPPSGTDTCSVVFETTDIFGKSINNVKILVEPEQSDQVNNNAIVLASNTDRTNFAGAAIIPIIIGSVSGNTVKITFEYLDNGVLVSKSFKNITIPDASTALFVDLI